MMSGQKGVITPFYIVTIGKFVANTNEYMMVIPLKILEFQFQCNAFDEEGSSVIMGPR